MNHEKENKVIYLYDDKIGRVELVESYGTDLTVVNAARVSFGVHKDALDDSDKKLIRYLIKHKHTSTLEHCGATFKFTVPLYIRSQHHRHRTWSYNEASKRYSSEDIKFYEPKQFRTQHTSNRQASNENELINPNFNSSSNEHFEGDDAANAYRNLNVYTKDLYENMLKVGICREQARGVLPQCTYTSYYGSVNFSNLLKFIDLRSHEGAQWEIQQVAKACKEFATSLWPETMKAYEEICAKMHIKSNDVIQSV